MTDSFDASAQSPDLQALRRQARQRFIGAAVLVLAAVVAIPLLIDFRPRPLSPNVAVQIMPATAAAPAATAAAPAVPVSTPSPAAAVASDVPAPAASTPSSRGYVVQAGSFKDKAKLHDAQAKLEKAGIKTYTQDAVAKDGSARVRIRVGPLASQEQAKNLVARMAKLGIKAAVIQP